MPKIRLGASLVDFFSDFYSGHFDSVLEDNIEIGLELDLAAYFRRCLEGNLIEHLSVVASSSTE